MYYMCRYVQSLLDAKLLQVNTEALESTSTVSLNLKYSNKRTKFRIAGTVQKETPQVPFSVHLVLCTVKPYMTVHCTVKQMFAMHFNAYEFTDFLLCNSFFNELFNSLLNKWKFIPNYNLSLSSGGWGDTSRSRGG